MFEEFMRRHLRRKGYVAFKPERREPEPSISLSLSIGGAVSGAISWMCVAAVAGPEGLRRLLLTTVEVLEEELEKSSNVPLGRIITVLCDGSDLMIEAIEKIVGHDHVTADYVSDESGKIESIELGFVVPPDEIDDVWEKLKARGWDCGRTYESTEKYEASKRKGSKYEASKRKRASNASDADIEWVGIGDNLEAKFSANGFLGIREIGSKPSGHPPRFGVGVTISDFKSLQSPVPTDWTNIDNCALQLKRVDEVDDAGAGGAKRWTYLREGTEDDHGPVIKMTSYSIAKAKALFTNESQT